VGSGFTSPLTLQPLSSAYWPRLRDVSRTARLGDCARIFRKVAGHDRPRLHVTRWLPANNSNSLGKITVKLGEDTTIDDIPVRLGATGIVVGKPSSRTIVGNVHFGDKLIRNVALKLPSHTFQEFQDAIISGLRRDYP
jgi:hypothetical protein